MSFDKDLKKTWALFSLLLNAWTGLHMKLFFSEKVRVKSRPLPGQQSKEWLEKVEELQQITRPGLPTPMSHVQMWFSFGKVPFSL